MPEDATRILKYFLPHEFTCDGEPCIDNMQGSTLRALDAARAYSEEVMPDVVYVLTSSWRSKVVNREAGGKSDSAHLKGYAVDIMAKDSRTRHAILHGLLKAGFTRIGIGEDFIHVDNDPKKPPNVVWNYYSHAA